MAIQVVVVFGVFIHKPLEDKTMKAPNCHLFVGLLNRKNYALIYSVKLDWNILPLMDKDCA